MSKSKDAFESLIGQANIKRKLNFYVRACGQGQIMPPFLFQGEKGIGKTAFVRAFAKNLNRVSSEPYSFLEINSSTIGKMRNFLDSIFIPILNGNRVFVFFDECHKLDDSIIDSFLTVLNTEKGHVRTLRFKDETYTFNFSQLVFCFATTEPHELFGPFKNRLETVDFEKYSPKELGQIIEEHCIEQTLVNEDALKGMIQSSRGNARFAVQIAQKVVMSAKMSAVTDFELGHWLDTRKELGILPLGLNQTEVNTLLILEKNGPLTLTVLAAKNGLSPSAMRRDIELYLHSQNLIIIDGKRAITERGLEVLKKIRELQVIPA